MPRPPNNRSGDDVFAAVPLKPLDDPRNLEAISDAVRSATPWGETPLYYAVAQAASEGFGSNGPLEEAEEILVVISDGKNEIWSGDPFLRAVYGAGQAPTATLGKENDALMIRQAVEALNARPQLRLFVLNCGAEDAHQQLDSLVFEKLRPREPEAKPRKISATRRGQLSDKLAEAVGAYKYELWNSKGEPMGASQWVGEATLAAELGDSRRRYEVRVPASWPDKLQVKRQFVVDGGESVTWNLNRDRDGLRLAYQGLGEWNLGAKADARRGNVENAFPDGKDDDLNPRDFRVAAVCSDTARDRNPTFLIAIQNNEPANFSPRPAEVWVEITPADAENPPLTADEAAPYVFQDPLYDTQRPGAPVLVCQARDWPISARVAEIRLWWTMADDPSSDLPAAPRQSIQRIRRQQEAGKPLKVAGSEVKFSLDAPEKKQGDLGARVIVDEAHAGEGEPEPFRVEMVPHPTTIIRSYFRLPAGRKIRHEFIFEGENEEQVQEHELRIAPRRLCNVSEGRAIKIEEPLRVPVR